MRVCELVGVWLRLCVTEGVRVVVRVCVWLDVCVWVSVCICERVDVPLGELDCEGEEDWLGVPVALRVDVCVGD